MARSRSFVPLCRLAGFAGLTLALGSTGCKSNPPSTPAPIIDANSGPDPAQGNNAPVSPASGTYQPRRPAQQQPARVLGQQAYPPAQAPIVEQYPEQQPGYQQNQAPANDQGYDEQAADAGEQALYADQAPPPLPEYQQPELADVNDQWTPGYWDYAQGGYFWVPGAWVAPPYVGALWTPGYWGAVGGRYRFHRGFWGRHIGFYGGVPYGFGYTGRGYEGGYWNGDRFFYNNAVNRVNPNIVRNVYVRNVPTINNNRVSFNGPGGWQARPTPSEIAVLHEQRTPPMQVQFHHVQAAAANRQQFYVENHGRPAVAVVAEHMAADRTAPPPMRPMPNQPERPAVQPQGQEQRNALRQQGAAEQQAREQQQNAQQLQQQNTQRQQQQNAERQQQLQQQNTQHEQQENAQRQQQLQQQNTQREQQQNAQRQQQLQQQNTQREQQQNALRQQQVQQRAVQDQQVRAQQQPQRQPQPTQQPPVQQQQRQPPPVREQSAPQSTPRVQEAPRPQPAPHPQPQQARPQPSHPAETPHAAEEHPKR